MIEIRCYFCRFLYIASARNTLDAIGWTDIEQDWSKPNDLDRLLGVCPDQRCQRTNDILEGKDANLVIASET